MTKLGRLWMAALVATTAVASAGTVQTYSLKRSASIGDSATYRLTMDVTFGDLSYKVTSTSALKVVRVDEDGTITTQTTQSDYKIKIKGVEKEITAPDSDATTAVRKTTGDLVSINADKVDASSYRLENLTAFLSPETPVRIGDRWIRDIKADSKTGAVGCRAEYELLSVDKVGPYEAAKIKWSIKETEGQEPGSGEGTIWIDVKDGSLVRSEGKLKNAPLRDAPRPVDFSFTTERVG